MFLFVIYVFLSIFVEMMTLFTKSAESGGVSRRLAEACEVAAFSKEKKQIYEEEKMNEWDIQAQKEYAVREGREEGRKEGFAAAKAEVAKSMLRENMPVDQIARLTGLSEAQITAL